MISRIPSPTGFRAFRHASFRFYWAGMLARGTAMWMLFVAIPWLVVELGGSAVDLGLIGALMFLPTLVATPLAGLWADTHPGARALLAGQAGTALQAALLLGLVVAGRASMDVLAVLSLGLGVLVALEVPIRQVYVAELVPPEELSSAVSLHSTAFNTTRFTGPGICAVLIASVGVSGAFAVAAVLSVVSVLAIVMIERVRVVAAGTGKRPGPRARPADAIRYVRASPEVQHAMLLASAASVFGIMTFQTLAPLFVVERLGSGGADYGALMAAWGVGAVGGAYASAALVHGRRLPSLLVGTAGISVALASLAASGSLHLALMSTAALGVSQSIVGQNALIAVQIASPAHLRGQLIAAYWLVFQGSSPVGAILAGSVAEAYGVQAALALAAACLAVIGGTLALRARPWRPPRPPQVA